MFPSATDDEEELQPYAYDTTKPGEVLAEGEDPRGTEND